MIRGLLVCLALVSVASAQNAQNNTRTLGLGAVGPPYLHQQGFNPGLQQGFNPGFLQQGFNPGFQQRGFNPGFQQQGFPGQVGGFPGQVGGFPGQVGGFPGQVGGFPRQVGGFPGQVGGFPGQVGGVNQIGVGVGSSGSNSCRRWCLTPQGQANCCETADEPLTAAVVKPGQCPPVRPQCPPTRIHNPPARCSSDGACAGHDKCCFDTCLQHHTCKPPIGLGK